MKSAFEEDKPAKKTPNFIPLQSDEFSAALPTDQEAEVVALACSQPPEGAARWTIRLLTIAARHRPRLEGINRESIRQILKKTSVNLGAR